MVWLMRHRGHARRPCWEMAASMFLPTFAVIGIMTAGISDDHGALMMYEHETMLLRYDEYAGCGHHHAPEALA